MVGSNQVTSSIVAGFVVSCGAVLVVAGASKLYRSARGVDGSTAIRRALRMPRHQWRRAELAVGATEFAMGVFVCSGASPVLGGVGLASFGMVFCVLLGYVRVRRVPGDCGCIRWRPLPETSREPTIWRAMVRGGMLFGVGIVSVIVPADTAGAPYRTGVRLGLEPRDLLIRRGPCPGRLCRSLLRRVIGGICGLMSRCVAGRASERGGPGVAAGGEGCCAGFAVTRRAGYGTNAGICGSIGGSCTCLLRGVRRCFRLRQYPVPQAASRRLMPPRGMAGSSVRRGTRRRGGPR